MAGRVVRVVASSLLGALCQLTAGHLFAGTPQAGNSSAAPVTFARDVAPLLFRRCAPCHRPDGSSAITLLTFEDARGHARQLAAVTASRAMPPWKPEPGYGSFEGDPRLTDAEITIFQDWLAQGTPEGNAAELPPAPRWSSEWQLGTPDLVLTMPAYALRAGGRDMFRNFVVPVPPGATRYVRAWEFHPGNARVVHHATMQVDTTGSSRRFDDQDGDAGYEGLIAPSARAPDGFFLDWAPGHRPNVAVEGTAWPLAGGADLVMMLHLRPSGKPETVQASVALYFSDRAPAKQPVMLRLTRQHLDIQAGERRYAVTDSYTLPVDVDVYTAQPHAHYLAREIRGSARLPDGRVEPLIYIKQWDFDWQDVYRYQRPIALPAGTVLTMDISYDNTADNPRNPNRPPRRVTYGQQTSDEMAELWFQVVPRQASDAAALNASLSRKILREEIVGRRMMLASDPDNVALHDDLALMLTDTGDRAAATAEFRQSLRIRPQSAAALFNVGAALVAEGKTSEARGYFERALAADPGHAMAHYSLAVTLPGTERPLVLSHLRSALENRPGWADAQAALAWVLAIDASATADARREAIQLARQAVATTGRRRAAFLDILATTLAADGDFANAIGAEKEAIALASRAELSGMQDRLKLFTAGQKFLQH